MEIKGHILQWHGALGCHLKLLSELIQGPSGSREDAFINTVFLPQGRTLQEILGYNSKLFAEDDGCNFGWNKPLFIHEWHSPNERGMSCSSLMFWKKTSNNFQNDFYNSGWRLTESLGFKYLYFCTQLMWQIMFRCTSLSETGCNYVREPITEMYV